jgi:hypothetical protein
MIAASLRRQNHGKAWLRLDATRRIYDVRHIVIDARPVIFFQTRAVVPWLEHRHGAARSIRGRTNEIHSP